MHQHETDDDGVDVPMGMGLQYGIFRLGLPWP
jgi:hypothetical protein